MGVKVTNNGFGTLSAGINSSATTVTVDSGQGARFPALSSGDFFFATLIDTSNNLEIIKVTARSTDSMTVTRAQDNTSARAFSIGDRIELRPTAALFETVLSEAIAGSTVASNSITTAMLQNDSVTDAKIATGITATKLSGDINYSNLPVGSVVQTVHTNASAQSVTAGPTTLQTGTITPKFASSKILFITNMNFHIDSAGGAYWRVQYNYSIAGGASGAATLGNNYLADAVGYPNSVYATGARMHYGGHKLFPSYNTTSAITFTVVVTRQGSSAGQLGCGYNNNNDMTLMEIKQ